MMKKFALALLGLGMSTGVAFAEGDAAAGETAFKKCAACHAVGEGARNKVGPQLNNLIGRQIGGVEDYRYGAATAAKGEDGTVWTEELLFEYLADPRAFVGGASKMPMKYPDEQFRKDVIAYLATFSEGS